jgi:hypothetical protein
MTLQLTQEFISLVSSSCMEFLHHLTAGSSSVVFHIDISEEIISHTLEGISRPGREPINCGTVDQRGES